jgi:multicomponent Na+:H+ antiporter subunit D
LAACNVFLKERRRTLDAIAVLAAASVTGMLGFVTFHATGRQSVYWFAGFKPSHGIAIGIDFAVDPLSAGLAAMAGLLVTAAMVFSWRYFEHVAAYFQVLMLTFLAGMVGFCLTGDIFDLFVWFELMGVSAYALTAYRPEERGPIQGALNFAITNSVGAYLSLSGIGLLYGRTGALNMAQIGTDIARHRPDGLVVVAFVLVISGLLVKSAIVPFQFWLADAHAVAPTPVCVLFSGVMVELGLYGVARVYWSMFAKGLGHVQTVSNLFLALGVVTAVVGALFAFRQRHLKRLLAFSTISHAGMFLTGIALATPLGLAGAAVYVLGHGLVKAALFLCVGIVLHRLGSVNETALHGRARHLRVTGVVFALAGLGLADLPPFVTFLGKGWIEESAYAHDAAWLMVVLIGASIVIGAAVLRVAGGVFFGLGDPPASDPRMASEAEEERSETDEAKQRTPWTMIIPPAVLVAAALALGPLSSLGPAAQRAAVRFEDQGAYNAVVLSGRAVTRPAAPAATEDTGVTVADVATGIGSAVGAVLVAGAALYRRRLRILRRLPEGLGLTEVVRRLQSGVVNDYVTWLVVGVAAIGGALAFSIR